MGLTRIPLTIVATATGARTEGVIVGVMAEQLDALERHVDHLDCEAALMDKDHKWRCAEANVSMLRDAIREFYEFVRNELDRDPCPDVGGYLNWDADRLKALREVLNG
jgi:hypothetical protein